MSPLPNFAGGPPSPSMGGPQQPTGQPGTGPAGSSGQPSNGSGTADQVGSAIQGVMGDIRNLGQTASALGEKMPALQDDVQQVMMIIKRMVIKAGQAAPTQTDSGSALPMG